MADNQQQGRNPDEIGALWKKQGKRGEFLSGELELDGKRQRVVVFPIDRKPNPNAPDFRILKAQERNDR